MTRTVEVDHDRLPRWLAGFADRHGETTVDGGALLAADGTTASLTAWGPLGASSLEALVEETAPPQRIGFVVVRRGGYAVAVSDGAELVERKVGRRHVQSRTAAGGWSQQRFARRRGKQADELVTAVTEHAVRLLAGARLDGLVRGGDRTLVADVLDDPRLRGLAGLPARELFDLPDPTPAVLERAVRRARSVRITLPE
ncbi:acVLRF1 family peptidyl-tRNA hydrolase [Pseudactinotalea suaedae]|uniref:acVLRF1 family peptidyl-tRNA hydrolase n=1 Tax=Pseudactinotalea suaedae TaxID=1524924 RepID=UPI0012E11809|nr:acVLRF1 family peptidyl-tRNA hydrolase [Pseudactinotalea suaedae]